MLQQEILHFSFKGRLIFKATAMQIEKALTIDSLRVSKAS